MNKKIIGIIIVVIAIIAIIGAYVYSSNSQSEHVITDDSRILVAYFSQTGNTEQIAQMISNETNADIFKIEASTPYPEDYDTLTQIAQEEQNSDARPEINNTIDNISDYDVIFIGYPIWWGDMPQIMYTFLESYDFNGKTVIPFSTSGGSGLADTIEHIQTEIPNANVVENGFTIDGSQAESAENDINNWLNQLR